MRRHMFIPEANPTCQRMRPLGLVSFGRTCSARTYLLVDGSRFARVAPHTIAPLAEFEAVILDGGLAAAARAELVTAGVEILG